MCKFLVQVTSESYYYMNFCFVPIHNDIKLYKPLMKRVSNFNFTSSQVNMCEKNIERKIFLNLGFKSLLFGFLLKKNKVFAIDRDFYGNNSKAYETKSGIQIIDFKVGDNNFPQWGSLLKVKYVAYIKIGQDIKKIDSTYERKDVFTFQHGNGELNVAFEEAVHSMQIGGKRRVVVKINSEKEVLNSGPISPLTGIRQELKNLFKNNIKNNKVYLIYDIELTEIIDKLLV